MLGPLPRQFHRLVQDVDEPGLVHRFLEEVEGARLPGFDRPGDGALSAHDDHLGRLVGLLQPPQQGDAVHVGQHQVGQHDVGPPLPEDFLAAGADQRRTALRSPRLR